MERHVARASGSIRSPTAQRGDLEDAVTATGILQPRDYVDVGTQVSGQLKKLHVEIGSVGQGRPAARRDRSDRLSVARRCGPCAASHAGSAACRQAGAARAGRAAAPAAGRTSCARTRRRRTRSTPPPRRCVRPRRRSACSRRRWSRRSSSLRGDEANLNYTKIYAPMAGTVVAQSAKQGQTLNANQSAPIVVRIADLSAMTVQSQVSEADVPKLTVGQDVYFTTLGSQTKRWTGKLRQINPTPEVVNNVVLYNALFDVENPDRALMTQMTAQVFFVTAQAKDAVLVPVSALRPVGAGERQRTAAGENTSGQRRQASSVPPSAAALREGGRRPRAANAESSSADAKAGAAKSGGARMRASEGIDPRTRFANGRAVVRVLKADGTLEERRGSRRRDEPGVGADPLGARTRRAGRRQARPRPPLSQKRTSTNNASRDAAADMNDMTKKTALAAPHPALSPRRGEGVLKRWSLSPPLAKHMALTHNVRVQRRSSSLPASPRPTATATSRSKSCTASTSRSIPASSSRSSASPAPASPRS